jgi:hypothetical protein
MLYCDDCKWAEWKKTKNGRLHPSKSGACKKVISIPKIPVSFYWLGGEPRPIGGGISRGDENKEHCVYYERG